MLPIGSPCAFWPPKRSNKRSNIWRGGAPGSGPKTANGPPVGTATGDCPVARPPASARRWQPGMPLAADAVSHRALEPATRRSTAPDVGSFVATLSTQAEPIGNITSGFDLHPDPQDPSLCWASLQQGAACEQPPGFPGSAGWPLSGGLCGTRSKSEGGITGFRAVPGAACNKPVPVLPQRQSVAADRLSAAPPDNEWTLQRLEPCSSLPWTWRAKLTRRAWSWPCCQGRAGQGRAPRQVLDARREDALQRSLKLQDARYQGDTWGIHKRRLSALAQAYSVIAG